MRAADRYTIETLGVPSETLMERAGKAVADEAEKALAACGGRRVLAVCGGGNNGGDGFAIGRILLGKGGKVTRADYLNTQEFLDALDEGLRNKLA